jgi:excisionase family DNA binding protein
MENIKENSNLEPLLTVKQVAKYLSVDQVTVYNWIRSGKLKVIRFSNRVRVTQSEVERYVGEIKKNLNK